MNKPSTSMSPRQGGLDEEVNLYPELEASSDEKSVVGATDAEPLIPWKQSLASLIACALLIITVLGISRGVGLPSRSPETKTRALSRTSPCSDKVSSSAQKLDMLLVDPYIPRVVMDGENALAVAHGPDANSNFNVVFYSLSNEVWDVTSAFVEENFDQFYAGGKYSSAISGNTALVGLWESDTDAGEDAGVVEVFTQDDKGLWKQMNYSLVPDDGGISDSWFGFSVDMDGSLACVAAAFEGAVYVFEHQYGDRWSQVDKVLLGQFVWECLIAGTTLAVQTMDEDFNFYNLHIFKYDQEEEQFKKLQDPLPVNGFRILSEDYLVYSTITYSISGDYLYDGVSIYHRQGEQETYSPLQFFAARDHPGMFGARLAMDKDTLVVYDYHTTVIFSEHNGYWEEALTLNRPYMSYQIAGHHVLAMGLAEESLPDIHYEVHSFNVKDCMQSNDSLRMPTDSCIWVEVNILADSYPDETSWSISHLTNADGIQDKNIIHGNDPVVDLQVDLIPFSAEHIHNSTSDTVVNGELCDCGLGKTQCECREKVCLIERGDIMFHEKASNCQTGGGLAAIIYDNGDETGLGWTLYPESADIPAVFVSQSDGQYLLEHGLSQAVVMTVYVSHPLTARARNSRRMCLGAGHYQFMIHDNANDGICCSYGKGRYNVTTDGHLIVEGGEFGNNETTTFHLPIGADRRILESDQ